jgi:hypothetical protein
MTHLLKLICEAVEPDLDYCDPEPDLDAARVTFRGKRYVLLILPAESVVGALFDALADARGRLAAMGRSP